jgi:hypothetical protein
MVVEIDARGPLRLRYLLQNICVCLASTFFEWLASIREPPELWMYRRQRSLEKEEVEGTNIDFWNAKKRRPDFRAIAVPQVSDSPFQLGFVFIGLGRV